MEYAEHLVLVHDLKPTQLRVYHRRDPPVDLHEVHRYLDARQRLAQRPHRQRPQNHGPVPAHRNCPPDLRPLVALRRIAPQDVKPVAPVVSGLVSLPRNRRTLQDNRNARCLLVRPQLSVRHNSARPHEISLKTHRVSRVRINAAQYLRITRLAGPRRTPRNPNATTNDGVGAAPSQVHASLPSQKSRAPSPGAKLSKNVIFRTARFISDENPRSSSVTSGPCAFRTVPHAPRSSPLRRSSCSGCSGAPVGPAPARCRAPRPADACPANA